MSIIHPALMCEVRHIKYHFELRMGIVYMRRWPPDMK
jgi:hypothetical protein